MTDRAPPRIFSSTRRLALRRRARWLGTRPDAARYLHADMVEDVLDRLSFLRHQPQRALVVGDWLGQLAAALAAQGCAVECADPAPIGDEVPHDDEAPLPHGGYELIATLGTLDTVNDLPGALLHLTRALAPGGLLIAEFMGAGSLPVLRAAMLAADGERPAARLHPMVDVRAGGQLLQRAGLSRPVVDSRGLDARFSTLPALLADLRAQGLGNALAKPAAPLGKAARARAEAAFQAQGDATGRVTEHFEILTLSGWRG